MLSRTLLLYILSMSIILFGNIISGDYIYSSKNDGATSRGYFGSSVANIGDLDNNGVEDLVVGVPFSDSPNMNSGSVEILFMETSGSYNKVTVNGNSSFLTDSLLTEDLFGSSVSFLDDFYGNGNKVIAVGAPGADYSSYTSIGCLWIIELNSSGTILSSKRIKYPDNDPDNFCLFGSSSTSLKGINSLNNRTLAVGAPGFDSSKGCISIIKLNIDNTITLIKKITGTDLVSSVNIGDTFGASLCNAGDLDNNDVDDLYAGAPLSDSEGLNGNGAFYIIYLNSDGSVKEHKKFSPAEAGIFFSNDYSQMGNTISTVNDIDRDGNNEILVGSYQKDLFYLNRGSIDIVSLDHDENLQWTKSFYDTQLNDQLASNIMFGSAVTGYQDMNGNGIPSIICCSSDYSNGIGALFTLDVSGPVRTDSAYIENAFDVDLSCTANTKGIDTELHFEYGLTTSLGSTLSYGDDINSSDAEPFSKSVTILDTNTTYYYRAVTSNSNGISSGEIISFLTPSTVRPGTPMNIRTTVFLGSIMIEWDPCENTDGYKIYASNDPYGAYSMVGTVTNNKYTVPVSQAMKFYYIVATNSE